MSLDEPADGVAAGQTAALYRDRSARRRGYDRTQPIAAPSSIRGEALVDWSDVLKLALSIFLIVTGLGLAYLFLRMAGVFGRLGVSVTRLTDEVVPILNKTQTTVDGVNLELARVDEIMKTAVGATKGAEKTVQTVSSAVTTPVRKLTGLAAGAREAVATLRARRAADAGGPSRPASAPGAAGAAVAPPPPVEPPPPSRPRRRRPRPARPPSGTTRPTSVSRLVKLGALAGVIGWLASIGALDPRLWADTIARERKRIPEQVKEAIAAGKRAAAQAEEDLDREVREAFRPPGGGR